MQESWDYVERSRIHLEVPSELPAVGELGLCGTEQNSMGSTIGITCGSYVEWSRIHLEVPSELPAVGELGLCGTEQNSVGSTIGITCGRRAGIMWN